MTIRTAVIGLGIMGRRMAENMVLHPDFTVTTMWDPDPAACVAAQKVAPEAAVSATASEAMADVDLVYLACPPVPRKAYALEAAAAGKAIFLEKPLGVDIAESRALVAELQAAGVPAAVNFTQAAGAALTDLTRSIGEGALGDLCGIDIIVTYPAWPRAWQVDADWLRFAEEGGMTREVISHFLFLSERVLGPLTLQWAHAEYPDAELCETHVAARLVNAEGLPVSILGSVGGVQPDRQEVTVKGAKASRRISEFAIDTLSTGEAFAPTNSSPTDTRATSLKAQLDDMALLMDGGPSRLATPEEALRVQELIEGILANGRTQS
ncbi:MAG: Gfo/Idh/MocA family oxidoreductase [Sulfitobacter sp.]|uniref:Gfo/Idh/MocA family protein n=1 Tax=unclassified Sulfitobacter TaxID=196795 RepID=UPI0007C3E6E0|nr:MULTISPECIES: Gfo/Idh/MocA family oxidoreductase [unclassified Sulfitobacter]KZX99306.1 oxidoreductase [Sulfitobacter sp. HI0021]KZY04428.1 oxidoreductase [Sulfitobacter sp. HI0027]KZY99770.1 oxidoreductase [Sulfitobacter sp. HI0076]HAC49573.1 gfo/Idh/MocA family oxidoreductase [Sulfitobacter sp.]|tara:strand:- start:1370 stop:2338 length:969 start_codon:yes stop_codon:yes gene_type:complete